MLSAAGTGTRGAVLMPIGILLGLVLLTTEVAAGRTPTIGLAATFVLAFLALGLRFVTPWRNLIAATLLVILLIPIRRYQLPASLPFELEPYRILIAVIAAVWIAALLVDRDVLLRRSIVDPPMVAVLLIAAASVAVNVGRLENQALVGVALKSMTFLFSYVLFFYFLISVIRRRQDLDFVIRLLVAGGSFVAAASLVELWAGFNVFDHVDRVIPVLVKTADSGILVRGGYTRVFASAQHPIALGSLFALLVPLSIYLFMSSRRVVWLGAASLFCVATFATVSRTGVLSLVVVTLVYLILRPREMVRFWPLLLPVLLAIKIAMPGVLGTTYHGFFPEGGLIAEQADGSVGSSRVASFGPALDEISLRPLLGLGYGTRIPSGPGQNSFILDDQWLATAMEIGLLGFAAWVWLFVRFLRKMFRSARRERGDRGWLFTSIAASTAGFAVGMVTYDAFSFIQVTFGLFVVLALGSAASALADRDRDAVPA